MPPRKRRGNVKPAGQIRQSQIVTTFGPGAMVDLPSRSVVIGGLELWDMKGSGFTTLSEPRLQERLEKLMQHSEITGAAFKMTDDPRVTRSGRLLRRSSLDELPQLWNVLRGNMSLVGPRPALPREVDTYDLWHRRRLSMKPGITGLWQVSARRSAEFDRWAELDLSYIDRWSLWLDIKILARTLPAAIEGR